MTLCRLPVASDKIKLGRLRKFHTKYDIETHEIAASRLILSSTASRVRPKAVVHFKVPF